MTVVFSGANSFNQDLCKWDMSRVTGTRMMFLEARSFNHDLSNWDMSRVDDMAAMFSDAPSFEQDLSKVFQDAVKRLQDAQPG